MIFTRETQATDAEIESFKMPDLAMDSEGSEQNRISVWSNDSGIERDLPVVEEKEPTKLYRKPCIKKKDLDPTILLQNLTKAPKGSRTGTLQRLSGQSTEVPSGPDRLPTARVVILGDDRALGRLAKTYYSFRYQSNLKCGSLKVPEEPIRAEWLILKQHQIHLYTPGHHGKQCRGGCHVGSLLYNCRIGV